MTFQPPTADDLAMLEAERTFVPAVLNACYPDLHLTGELSDLQVLQQIFDGGPYTESAVAEAIALGTSFGDLFALTLGMEWVNVPEYDGALGLRLEKTSIVIFPRDMIIKRIEEDRVVNLQELFDGVTSQVKEMVASGEYQA